MNETKRDACGCGKRIEKRSRTIMVCRKEYVVKNENECVYQESIVCMFEKTIWKVVDK